MEDLTMKKFMIAFAALAMVMSCTTEKLTQDIPAEEPATNGTVVTLTANLPALTKATVDNTAFSWSDGDQISLPSSKGEAIFTTTGDGTFTCTLGEGEVLVSGTAKYPATAPGNTFSSIEDAKKAFMMEATYNVGDKSITFNHKSAIVKVSFTNVPSFATGLKVTEGETVVATIANVESTSGNTVHFFVPITPNGNKKYTFTLMEHDNVVKSAAKTVDLIAGTYYTTPEIAVKYIQVGVRDFIYGNTESGTWNLKTNWKVRYWGGSTGDAILRDLNMTETKTIPNYYTDGVFQLFYTVDVPTNNIDGFKVWCDTSGNDWFGNTDAAPTVTKVYVFEWDYGNEKLAYYE